MDNSKKSNHKLFFILILLLLLLLGGFLRLWNLAGRSLWVDEVNTVFAAQSMNQTGEPLHPSGVIYRITPLFTRCVAFTYQMLGADEGTSRIPAAFFGILAIVLVYYCAQQVFNKRVGLFSAFLMTLSHFEIGWSRVSRYYTLLQVITLLVVIFFIKGFEHKKGKHNDFREDISKPPFFTRLKLSLARMNISPLWLLLLIIVLMYSFVYIHELIAFVAGGFLAYMLFMSIVGLYWKEKFRKIINKYTVTSVLVIAGALGYYYISPGLHYEVNFFLGYTPPWAIESSPVTDQVYLFNFLISSLRFPLAVFFFLGCVQLMSRRNQLGWILLWVFVVPLFLLSFVYTHRAPRYLFYVYPFFLILSSYGFINIIENEVAILRKDLIFKYRWMRYFIISAFFVLFFISPWFRISVKIPFQDDGVTNGAVTTEEWKEVASFIKDKVKEDDVVITSLPQVAYYYDIKSDYGLNGINLNRAKMMSFKNEQGQWTDIFVGIPCIESLEEFKQILRSNEKVWIIVTKYHFDHPSIISSEVRDYITGHFIEFFKTKHGTVFVFYGPQ